jgi:hypothetical protein
MMENTPPYTPQTKLLSVKVDGYQAFNTHVSESDFELIKGRILSVLGHATPPEQRAFTLDQMKDAFNAGADYVGSRELGYEPEPDINEYFRGVFRIDINKT